MLLGSILSFILHCGVDPSRDCSTEDLSTTTVIFYFGGTYNEYHLNARGAIDLVSNQNFDISKETVIFLHGFTRTPNSPGSLAMKDAFILRRSTVNYLAINATDVFYGQLYNFHKYKNVAQKSVCLGKAIGKFLVHLNRFGVSENNLYTIGHSLGCPTISFGLKYFINITQKKIYRATGLDCVGPCFYPFKELQLSSSDAQLVDAMHTNMYFFGTPSKIGIADFYPNGGIYQKSCMFTLNPMCSHAKALFYYSETVNSDQCIGSQIPDLQSDTKLFRVTKTSAATAPMGYFWRNQTGSFYLNTYSDPPYCQGEMYL